MEKFSEPLAWPLASCSLNRMLPVYLQVYCNLLTQIRHDILVYLQMTINEFEVLQRSKQRRYMYRETVGSTFVTSVSNPDPLHLVGAGSGSTQIRAPDRIRIHPKN